MSLFVTALTGVASCAKSISQSLDLQSLNHFIAHYYYDPIGLVSYDHGAAHLKIPDFITHIVKLL